MVDIHSHIIPGLDDGAESLEEALVMARLAVSSGIRHMAATSHGNYYDYTLEEYRESLEKLQEELAKEAIPLKLYPGMEIFLDDDAAPLVQRKELLSLNHTDYLLVEFPFEESEGNVLRRIRLLQEAGWKLFWRIRSGIFLYRRSGACVLSGRPGLCSADQRRKYSGGFWQQMSGYGAAAGG